MAERFTKLQAFPENLYTDMAPVVIIAGNLLKDNQLSRVLAQLKIQNIDKRTINEMTLQFRLMDVNGKTLDDAYVCKIEHTQIAENDFYGSKNPVTIPNANVCSCDIKVTQVKFADGTEWNCGNNWIPLDTTTNINGVKENRDRKLSEATRKKEKEEYEARMREEKYRAEKANETKKKMIIIAIIVAIIFTTWATITTISNSKIEKQIMANLVGSVFSHVEETDVERLGADYNYAYYNWNFNEEITFDADGRFTYVSTHIQYYYPDSLGRKNEARENQSIVDTHSGNYSVNISLFGKVSLELPSDTSSAKYYTADGSIGNPTFSAEIILENGKPYGLMMSDNFYFRVK